MKYLSNAFSLQMVPRNCVVSVKEVKTNEIPTDVKSVIGHLDTANAVSTLLGREIPMNRESISLTDDDVLYVAQVIGGRLPEGATAIPQGMEIIFEEIYFQPKCEHCNGAECSNCGATQILW